MKTYKYKKYTKEDDYYPDYPNNYNQQYYKNSITEARKLYNPNSSFGNSKINKSKINQYNNSNTFSSSKKYNCNFKEVLNDYMNDYQIISKLRKTKKNIKIFILFRI